MTLTEIVMKLIGPVDPIGETREDDRRFENLKVLTTLADDFLTRIDRIAADKNSHMFSVSRAGKHCSDFLDLVGIKED